jgi:hypothetical protein
MHETNNSNFSFTLLPSRHCTRAFKRFRMYVSCGEDLQKIMVQTDATNFLSLNLMIIIYIYFIIFRSI